MYIKRAQTDHITIHTYIHTRRQRMFTWCVFVCVCCDTSECVCVVKKISEKKKDSFTTHTHKKKDK